MPLATLIAQRGQTRVLGPKEWQIGPLLSIVGVGALHVWAYGRYGGEWAIGISSTCLDPHQGGALRECERVRVDNAPTPRGDPGVTCATHDRERCFFLDTPWGYLTSHSRNAKKPINV